ncbi:hypothetical protein OQA88_2996 [Cercophora sp. LCS_1]
MTKVQSLLSAFQNGDSLIFDVKGWADSTDVSYTWFDVGLHRPEGRSDLGAIRINHNRVADSEFFVAMTRWDAESSAPRAKSWLRSVQPGDVIQLIPRAQFPGWVNIVRGGSIELEYEVRTAANQQGALHIPNPGHVYRSLDNAAQQIRILAVNPGEYDDDIEAQFEYINLNDPETERRGFHALSYYWGDSLEKFHISISGKGEIGGLVEAKIGISATLQKAIRRLRSRDKPLRIWIDAVCINQDDFEERAQQVAMMGTVYSELDTITQAEEWHSFGYTREVFYRHRISASFDALATEAAGGSDPHFTFFMQTFFYHPWFQRVWVVQEAILSPNTVVYSATEEIPFEELLLINEMASTPEYAGEARWSVQTRDSMPAIWNALVGPHGRMRTSSNNEPMPILEVFLKALDLKATDQRDKLFALLAFGHETKDASKIPPLLKPDYNKPLPNTMADFTRWWILEYHSLDILSFVHCQPTRAWRRALCDTDPRLSKPTTRPTWALGTDGYAQWSHMTLREQFPSLLRTDATPDESLLRSENPLELSLRGATLGTITALDHPPAEMVSPRNITNPDGALAAVFNRLFDPSARMGAWLLQGTNYHEENWDADVLSGMLDGHTSAHASVEGQGQHVLVPGASGPLERRRYEPENLPGCVEKCFFLLGNGMFGLCPWMARVGDVVVILRGGRVPFILRAVTGDREERYEFVGECYVEGLGEGDRLVNGDEVFVLV